MLLCEDIPDEDAGISLAVAAEVVGVSKATVGMWVVRGKVRVVGRDRGGRLYRYGDVIDTAVATAEHPNNRYPRPVPA